ncbi:uncharacterized protein [Rutidosis leptorrhynchoides]|uniref:uncharacterized protein n=1 Tax=Rutidosis leptorrhynchoides TaxID=125765 RepID=UPI003A996D3B
MFLTELLTLLCLMYCRFHTDLLLGLMFVGCKIRLSQHPIFLLFKGYSPFPVKFPSDPIGVVVLCLLSPCTSISSIGVHCLIPLFTLILKFHGGFIFLPVVTLIHQKKVYFDFFAVEADGQE